MKLCSFSLLLNFVNAAEGIVHVLVVHGDVPAERFAADTHRMRVKDNGGAGVHRRETESAISRENWWLISSLAYSWSTRLNGRDDLLESAPVAILQKGYSRAVKFAGVANGSKPT